MHQHQDLHDLPLLRYGHFSDMHFLMQFFWQISLSNPCWGLLNRRSRIRKQNDHCVDASTLGDTYGCTMLHPDVMMDIKYTFMFAHVGTCGHWRIHMTTGDSHGPMVVWWQVLTIPDDLVVRYTLKVPEQKWEMGKSAEHQLVVDPTNHQQPKAIFFGLLTKTVPLFNDSNAMLLH